jgi:hypothetical protein
MADTLKKTESQLKADIAALLNEAARETDVKKKQSLTSQAKALKKQLDGVVKQRESNKNLSVVEKARKELERLNKLDPNTPGIAPLKAVQERIIADATKRGLPATEGTPSVIAAPKKEEKPKPTVAAGVESNTRIDPLTLAREEAAKTKATAAKSKSTVVASDYAQRNAGIAAMGGTLPAKVPTDTTGDDIQAIYDLAKSKYANVDSIFLYDDELRQLLIDAVKDPSTAEDDMKPDEFLRRLNSSEWMVRNADTYSKRDAQRREFNDLLSKYETQLSAADTQDKKDAINKKIGELKSNSAYARGLAATKAFVERTAGDLIGTLTPEQLDSFVKRMYDSANDKDANIITKELSYLINYKPGSTLGGSTGVDLTELRKTAAANGFDLDRDFGSSINTWLQRLAVGESVETFKNVIRSQAKLGLPDKVANLLDQGLDLDAIYSPYKKLMAATLEVTPDSIQLNDPTLRSAIGPEKEMSLYDFQRSLRQDARWQYTDNAREDVSNSALKVLQDFGFQG